MAPEGLRCKLVAQLAFKAGGDLFHNLVANKPHHLAKATPTTIQACDVIHGSYGTNGSVIQWKYTVDGKPQIAKQVLQDIDKEKRQIAYKMLEGDLNELYKDMLITIHIETKGGVDHVTWTIEYELLKPENPHPLSLLSFFIQFTNELEAHIFG